MAPTRKQHRLAEPIYQRPGAYFLTFITAGRHCSLGEIRESCFYPSALGSICEEHLSLLHERYEMLMLDEHVVMPNHIHLILFYENYSEQAMPSVAQVIGWLKAGITRDWRKLTGSQEDLWQRDFYDHVIQSEDSLFHIRNYIRTNCLQWSLDRENPNRAGVDPFDQWWQEQIKSTTALDLRYVPLQREP